MAGKLTGLGATVTIDDASGTPQVLSNDVTDYQFATPYGVQDVTGVDKSARERLLLLQDGSATFNGVFNADANREHVVFSGDKRVSRTVVILAGTATMTMEMFLTDYQIKRTNTGELTYTVPAVLNNGTAPAWT